MENTTQELKRNQKMVLVDSDNWEIEGEIVRGTVEIDGVDIEYEYDLDLGEIEIMDYSGNLKEIVLNNIPTNDMYDLFEEEDEEED